MLKVRITYNREDEKELKKAIEKLEKEIGRASCRERV